MIKPRQYNSQQSLLSPELLAEQKALAGQAPTFGRTAPEGYKERAKAFNEKMKELGATTLMVVEE